MGLASRKIKQRIGSDPRNLSWADDANKFGATYLSKLGWSAGTGLGTNGEGRTSHIKVNQKLDMLGIGAAHQRDPNGIAWQQNKDFENLLRRLNTGGVEENSDAKVDGFVKAGTSVEDTPDPELGDMSDQDEMAPRKDTKEKKRKRSKRDDTHDGERLAKKSKEEKREERKNKKKSKTAKEEVAGPSSSASPPKAKASSITLVGPPMRAHRARFMAAKRMALNAGSAMDEVLGISRSDTSSPYPKTSIPEASMNFPVDDLSLQELKTSSKSVMDYFKEKLMAKINPGIPTFSTPKLDEFVDYSDGPRAGLGASGDIGARAMAEEHDSVAEETEKRGFGVSRFNAMFAPTSVSSTFTTQAVTEAMTEFHDGTDGVHPKEKKRKQKKEKDRDKGAIVDAERAVVTRSDRHKKKAEEETYKTQDASEDFEGELRVSVVAKDASKKKRKKAKERKKKNVDS